MIKKIFILGIAITLSVANASAQNGETGPLTWKIENDTLIISGKGEMPVYGPPPHEWDDDWGSPWRKYGFSEVVIENGVENIGQMAFFTCMRPFSISIANSVTEIGNNAFCYSGLTSIEIPNSVTIIDYSAFNSCTLSSVILPKSVTAIGDAAFFDCVNLTSITNLNPVPLIINSNVFDDVDKNNCTLHVPKSSVFFYKAAPVWKEFNIVGDVSGEEFEEPVFKIYPNPTTGVCSVLIPQDFSDETVLTLSIYDVSGTLLQQIQLDDTNKFNLMLEAKGIYIAVLSNGKKSYQDKIMFE